MKFRSSFTINNFKNEQRKQQVAVTPFPVNDESVAPEDSGYPAGGCLPRKVNRTPTSNTIEAEFNATERPVSTRRSVSNFFRGLKAKDAPYSSYMGERYGRRPSTTEQASRVKRSTSNNKKKTRLSFDIDDDVIERLMGPPKDPHIVKVKSDAFLLKQRQRLAIPPIDISIAQPPSPAPTKPPVQQVRSPICRQELDAMFRGAPFFSVDEATLAPKVSFMEEGEELVVNRNLDHKEYDTMSFAASTTAIEGVRTLEIPSMLSANGLDPGTVGLEYFLQLPIADMLEKSGSDKKFKIERRQLLGTQPEKLGLRGLDMRAIAERLARLDVSYANLKKSTVQMGSQEQWSVDRIAEMGEHLFTEFIDAELGISAAGTGSVVLSTQIEALLKVLGQADLWYDFSRTETRLQLGQILFEQDHAAHPTNQPSERDLLLLQITLSAELLVRFEAVTVLNLQHVISGVDLERLKAQMSTPITWNLLVAERFLDHLNVSESKQAHHINTWGGTPVSATAPRALDDTLQPFPGVLLTAKSIDQQKSALLEFAAAIRWPHLDDVETHVTENDRYVEEVVSNGVGLTPLRLSTHRPVSGMTIFYTPPSSPGLPMLTPTMSNHSDYSYFSAVTYGQDRKQQDIATPRLTVNFGQTATAEPVRVKIEPWITQHWLSGLVLPGGSVSELLMGTLLETSPPSLWTLGPLANLHNGFVYRKQAFWSKESVVGRILAAAQGVVESMNWVSIPTNLLSGVDDGWVNIEPRALPKRDHEPRIKRKAAVSKASDPLHGQSETIVQALDFTTPNDSPPIMGNEARLDGLSFKTAAYGPGTMQLTFSSPVNTRLVPVVLPLLHDVYFIASYPCQPPPPLPSPNTLTRSLTGSSHVSRPVSSALRSYALPVSQPALPVQLHTPISRPHTSGGASESIGPRTRRLTRTISGLALTSRPNTFYETAADPALSDSTESPHPSPPSLDHESSTDGVRSILSRPSQTLTLDLTRSIPAAHPLHVGYTFTVVPAAMILTAPPETLDPRALSVDLGGAGYMLASRQASIVDDAEHEIMVLDCRGSADLEVLARAWCSKIGEHALIGKVGRTCLACCVREARGLGVGVVIRV